MISNVVFHSDLHEAETPKLFLLRDLTSHTTQIGEFFFLGELIGLMIKDPPRYERKLSQYSIRKKTVRKNADNTSVATVNLSREPTPWDGHYAHVHLEYESSRAKASDQEK